MAIWREDYVQINKFSRPGTKRSSTKGIVEHWTANPGATDENHAAYFDGADGGGSRYAGAHIFVDRDSSTVIIPLDEVAYHANDKSCRVPKLGSNANLTTIAIELCVERDGTIHPDTVARAEDVTAELCKIYGLDSEDVYRHYDITGKNCPAPWVANKSLFDTFKSNVNAKLTSKPAPAPAPSKPAPAPTTGSIVDYLKAIGQDSSFAYRSKLAAQHGISGYQGTAEQNESLLAKLRSGSAPKPAAPKPAPKPAPVAPKKEYAYFPPGHGTWSVYPTSRQPVKRNAIGAINPTKFGGLKYEVKGKPYPNVVTIHTSDFGRVNIFVGDPNSKLIWI